MIVLDAIDDVQVGSGAPPRQGVPSLRTGGEGGGGGTPGGWSKYRIGLSVILCVATVLFGITVSAYFARMRLGDWQPLQDPWLLWINTAVLIFASLLMQIAVTTGRAHRVDWQGPALWAGGGLAMVFLVGQVVAWQALQVNGYEWTKHPADSFFYLLTGLHGLHLIGGLVAWGRTMYRRRQRLNVQLSVELCAVYWHFLLIVWLLLFALLLST